MRGLNGKCPGPFGTDVQGKVKGRLRRFGDLKTSVANDTDNLERAFTQGHQLLAKGILVAEILAGEGTADDDFVCVVEALVLIEGLTT